MTSQTLKKGLTELSALLHFRSGQSGRDPCLRRGHMSAGARSSLCEQLSLEHDLRTKRMLRRRSFVWISSASYISIKK